MAIFAIALNDDEEPGVSEQVASRIKDAYPGCLPFSENLFLVHSDGIAESVATDAGIMGEDSIKGAIGAVFKLNDSYSGFTYQSLWEWLENAQEKG